MIPRMSHCVLQYEASLHYTKARSSESVVPQGKAKVSSGEGDFRAPVRPDLRILQVNVFRGLSNSNRVLGYVAL